MSSGVLLIVVGVAAIGTQLGMEFLHPSISPPISVSQQINVSPNQLSASTHFVGLELVLIGALLEIVGYVSAKPWKELPQSK